MQKEKTDGEKEGEVDGVSGPVVFTMNEWTSDSILNDIN